MKKKIEIGWNAFFQKYEYALVLLNEESRSMIQSAFRLADGDERLAVLEPLKAAGVHDLGKIVIHDPTPAQEALFHQVYDTVLAS